MLSDVYRQVTDRIIEQLENGTPPWRRPWDYHSNGIPRNVVSKRPYRGINVFTLWHAADQHDFRSGLWGTYCQWEMLGGHVRRGERATKIVFWNAWDETAIDMATTRGGKQARVFVKEHNVFCLEQVDGDALQRFQPSPKPNRECINFQHAEDVIVATGADIHHGGNRAYYSFENDLIVLPFKQCFNCPEDYWSVALHEVGHWTGHCSRLARSSEQLQVGSDGYATEELIAEMSAAFLTAHLGIPNTGWQSQSASYMASWLDVVKADSRAIVSASLQASRAADYILSFSKPALSEKEIAA